MLLFSYSHSFNAPHSLTPKSSCYQVQIPVVYKPFIDDFGSLYILQSLIGYFITRII
jgi:hypothetical protein